MPACKTDQWWSEDDVCCPQQCMDAYAAARARGRNEIAATMGTYRTDGSCSSAE
jgi:hypothetical protein